MKIKLPKEIKHLLKELNRYDYSAYVVGGAIRNQLLGLPVKDYDIATSATPDKVQEIFENKKMYVIPTGLQHGTVTVVAGKYNVEITTYRKDGEYSDNRRPDNVEFTTSLKEDLSRRDFTINALAYNPYVKCGIIDYFNGMKDLKKKKISCVGSAEERFNEDALRMARAIRFANQLNFDIDYDIRIAILNLKGNMKSISVERKREEFNKILESKHSIFHFSALKDIMPEIFKDTANYDNVGNGLLNILNTGDLITNLTILFIYDILDISMLETYKYDNHTIKTVKEAISCYEFLKSHWNGMFIESQLKILMKEHVLSKYSRDVVNIVTKIVIIESQKEIDISYKICDTIANIDYAQEPIYISDLALNGNDLKELHIVGDKIGKTLRHLQKYVWMYPQHNKKPILLDIAKRYKIELLNKGD